MYTKSFYKQNGDIDAKMAFSVSQTDAPLVFGITGDSDVFNFSGESGILYDSGSRIIGPCEVTQNEISIFSQSGYASLFVNDRLIDCFDISGLGFSGFYADSAAQYGFDFQLYADAPILTGGSITIGDDGLSTGTFSWSGEYPLDITSMTADASSEFQIDSWTDPTGTGTYSFVASGSGYRPTGRVPIRIASNAGGYFIYCTASKSFSPSAGTIDLWVDQTSGEGTKDQTMNFILSNSYRASQSVNLYLSEVTGVVSGAAEVDASGYLSYNTSFNYKGPRSVNATFTGDITGSGGRSGDIRVRTGVTARTSYRYEPTGLETREFSVFVTGVVGANTYYSYIDYTGAPTYATGGYFTYDITGITGVPTTATRIYYANQTIVPGTGDIFTGAIDEIHLPTGSFAGDLNWLYTTSMYVNEYSSEFEDMWNIVYDGDDYVASGWTGVSGIGTDAPAITVPGRSNVTGQITFSTDFVGTHRYSTSLGISGAETSLTISKYV